MNTSRQLLGFGELRLLKGTVSAGTDVAVVTDAIEIDMQGFDSVAIIFSLGAIATGGTITTRIKNSATSATYGSGTVDKIGSSLVNSADTDDNKFIVHQIHRPKNRYLRAEYQRETGNVTINGIFAILFNAGANPPANSQVEAYDAQVTPTPSTT